MAQKSWAQIEPSTKRSYEQLLRLHVTPRFGDKPLNKITRDQVKEFVSTISEKGDHALIRYG